MQTIRVLIVEDDFILCFLDKKYVEVMGYIVVDTVTNGKNAIAAVKEHKPDVVLMDIRLSGNLDGRETMNEIAKFDVLPVIYITASSNEKNRAMATKANVIGFCMKPLDFEELKILLHKVEKRVDV